MENEERSIIEEEQSPVPPAQPGPEEGSPVITEEAPRQEASRQEIPVQESSAAKPVFTPPAPPAKKPLPKWLIPAVAAVVVVALLAVLIPVMSSQNKVKRYNKGADMLESGDYQGAYEVFKDLGNYEDSFTLAMYAQRGIGYNAAMALMENGEYAKAAETFDGLSGFKDSRELADQCCNEIAYERAVSLYTAGDYTGAKTAFEELKGFKDADSYAARCGAELANIAYNKNFRLFDFCNISFYVFFFC